MTHAEIVRAWKDADYRDGLGDEARRRVPAHPAGVIELSDADMGAVIGGAGNTEHSGCTYEVGCTQAPITCAYVGCLVTPGTRRPGPQPPVPPPVIKG
jgi:mersacidin/lichenicidin family type 2 lantibiotic